MPRPTLFRLLALLALLAMLSLTALVGCSDSDSTIPNGGDPVPADTTAPLVFNLNPDNHDNGVNPANDVVITFTEPMDQGTLAPALTLSAGSITGTTWNAAGTEATISHVDWGIGIPVTVTVGTGVTDLAGNAMPQAFSSTFYTYSPDPVMIDYDFFADLGAVPPAGFFIMQFSHEMDLTSVYNAITLTEDGPVKAVPGFIIGAYGGDYTRVKIRWDGELTPLHTYHFTLGAGAQTRTGVALSAGFTIDFTAGTVVDETPPYILETNPALDAVVGTDLETVTITFSERIDPNYATPDERSALLDMFMAREPVWNDDGDELTIYLEGPLPAGIRFYAIWDESQLHDIAGNYSTSMDSLSFSTSGEATLFPVREDLRIYYGYSSDKDVAQMARQTLENIDGDNFERVLHRQTPTGFDEEIERWYMRQDGLDLLFRGFHDDSGPVMFNPALTYLPSPVPETWAGSTSITMEGQTIVLAFLGANTGTERQYFHSSKIVSNRAYLDNCVSVELYHSMTLQGATAPFETGTDWVYLCPGLGIIGFESEGTEFEDGVETDSWSDSFYIQGAAIDDRFESGF